MPEKTPSKYWLHPRTGHSSKGYHQRAQPKKSSTQDYVELHMLSNFSFLRGASHPEELIETAAELGYRAIALSDHHSLAGIVRAHIAAKQHGVQLLVGTLIPLYASTKMRLEKQITDPTESRSQELPPDRLPCSLLLYPSSRAAYGRLCQLLTRGKRRAYKGHCVLTLEDMQEHAEGLFATVLVHSFQHPALHAILERLKALFCDRLSLALYRSYGPDEHKRLARLSQISKQQDIPLVAQNAVHFHSRERKRLHDVLTCIRRGTTLNEAGLSLFQNEERCLKSPQEMQRLFQRFPAAIKRSAEIARAIGQFSLDELRYEYPREVCPRGREPQEYLTHLTWQHAQQRYPQGVPPKVAAQLHHELRLIEELSYAKYFLTVYDIVAFARSQAILCQGRGAAANSAVCFVLGITSVNPDKINLLFERFVSKERNEPPDIDIDFEHERREEVIQYIYRKYGRHRAALAAAVTTYRSKSAVRDVAKVFALAEDDIIAIQKLVSRDTPPYSKDTLRLRGLNPEDQAVQFAITLSRELLGFPRHLTQHVGGFVISEHPLSEIVPIENAAMPERTVLEWDKDDLEAMGMLKIDVLALGMLSCIRKALDLLSAKRDDSLSTEPLALHSIPAEDPKVYQMISRADTIGVFQIESRAQMSMLPRLRPQCFYDLVIEVAIVRPGPIQGGMVHPYLRRRHGLEPISYPSTAVREILAPTLGVPIFQEQVMQLAIHAAGFSPGEADNLRRAMSGWKQKENVLRQFEQRLLKGMQENGYSLSFAQQVFQQILGFGEYGFPQSHAAAFAQLVYASCWLKYHEPAVFCVALLNSQPMGYYRPAQLIDDAKHHGVEVHAIDILHSDWDAKLEHTSTDTQPAIRLGLRSIKGISYREVAEFLTQRPKITCPTSISSLWHASTLRVSTLKKLAHADAFGSLGLSRQEALWQIRNLRDEQLPLLTAIEQRSTTSLSETDASAVAHLPVLSQKAQVVRDYASTGMSLKAHPLTFLRAELSAQGVRNNYDLRYHEEARHGARWATAGMVLVRQKPMTASGVVFMTLEDETGLANLIIKPAQFARYRDILCDSTLLLVQGRIQKVEEVVHLLVFAAEDISARFYELPDEALQWRSRDFH